ncbi:hypothetical protein CDAR_188111 [Caerostris darwini]|uniref:Uncharacterized protein n=1 Tax=Caerostris darwini TaxID=1538125 RepID=A0AAV4NXK6_9ARAC|nr:hypothetical protein CDAR_188111 [Caerostris darwini]
MITSFKLSKLLFFKLNQGSSAKIKVLFCLQSTKHVDLPMPNTLRHETGIVSQEKSPSKKKSSRYADLATFTNSSSSDLNITVAID